MHRTDLPSPVNIDAEMHILNNMWSGSNNQNAPKTAACALKDLDKGFYFETAIVYCWCTVSKFFINLLPPPKMFIFHHVFCSFNISVKHLSLLWLYSVFVKAHCDNMLQFCQLKHL